MSTQETGDAAQTGEQLHSIVLLLRGATGGTEGVLELTGGRLTFTSTGVYHGAPLTGSDDRGDESARSSRPRSPRSRT